MNCERCGSQEVTSFQYHGKTLCRRCRTGHLYDDLRRVHEAEARAAIAASDIDSADYHSTIAGECALTSEAFLYEDAEDDTPVPAIKTGELRVITGELEQQTVELQCPTTRSSLSRAILSCTAAVSNFMSRTWLVSGTSPRP